MSLVGCLSSFVSHLWCLCHLSLASLGVSAPWALFPFFSNLWWRLPSWALTVSTCRVIKRGPFHTKSHSFAQLCEVVAALGREIQWFHHLRQLGSASISRFDGVSRDPGTMGWVASCFLFLVFIDNRKIKYKKT